MKAAASLGWTPADFWKATHAELYYFLGPEDQPEQAPATRLDLRRLERIYG